MNHLVDEALKHGAIPLWECPQDKVIGTKHSTKTHRVGHYVDDGKFKGWCVSGQKFQVINGLLWEYEEATK